MSIPAVNIHVSDGALGQLPASGEGIPAFVGVSSQGERNLAYSFNSLDELVDTLGTGPVVEAAAFVLANSGGPVVVVRVDDADDAAAGAVVDGEHNQGLYSPTVSGKPFDHYELVVSISRSGEPGTAAFRYSLDGGRNVSSQLLVPAASGEYEIPNTGITLSFPQDDGEMTPEPAEYVEGDTFAVTTTSASYGDSDLNKALEELVSTSRLWEFAHVVGALPEDEGEALARIALVGSKLGTAATQHKYAFAILELPEVEAERENDLLDMMLSVDQPRIQLVGGGVDLVSPLTGRSSRRSAAWAVSQRESAIPISEDPGRVRRGALSGLEGLTRDERIRPGFDAARITSLRTHIGRPGAFVTSGRMAASETSDYNLVQRRRVIDRACAVVYDALLNYLNESVRVSAETGFILQSDAASIEAFVGSALEAALVSEGHASSVSVRVNRTDNILSTEKLRVKVGVVPLAYARTIEAEVGLENPAIETA